jgi:hypothetical protein
VSRRSPQAEEATACELRRCALGPLSSERLGLADDEVEGSPLEVRRVAVPGEQLADLCPYFARTLSFLVQSIVAELQIVRTSIWARSRNCSSAISSRAEPFSISAS